MNHVTERERARGRVPTNAIWQSHTYIHVYTYRHLLNTFYIHDHQLMWHYEYYQTNFMVSHLMTGRRQTYLPYLVVAVSLSSTLVGSDLVLTPVWGAPAALRGQGSLARENWVCVCVCVCVVQNIYWVRVCGAQRISSSNPSFSMFQCATLKSWEWEWDKTIYPSL